MRVHESRKAMVDDHFESYYLPDECLCVGIGENTDKSLSTSCSGAASCRNFIVDATYLAIGGGLDNEFDECITAGVKGLRELLIN